MSSIDRRIRELERRATMGDLEAGVELRRLKRRSGTLSLMDELDNFLISAAIEELKYPRSFMSRLLRVPNE